MSPYGGSERDMRAAERQGSSSSAGDLVSARTDWFMQAIHT